MNESKKEAVVADYNTVFLFLRYAAGKGQKSVSLMLLFTAE